MSTILDAERALYQDVWSSVDRYADYAPGERYLPIFQSIVGDPRLALVLDAGTGSGKGALALLQANFTVIAVDVTGAGLVDAARDIPFVEACLWTDLERSVGRVDWVYCTDVLEHVPPQFTMLAVEQMLRVSRRGVFITVSLVPDNFGAWVGRSLHQTVQSFTWWRDSLRELGTVTEARDFITDAVFMVTR
jgi:SAM-dependent methyltransferase